MVQQRSHWWCNSGVIGGVTSGVTSGVISGFIRDSFDTFAKNQPLLRSSFALLENVEKVYFHDFLRTVRNVSKSVHFDTFLSKIVSKSLSKPRGCVIFD